MPSPSQLSRDLRLRSDPDLRRRRWLVGLSLFGVGIGQVVALYQTGRGLSYFFGLQRIGSSSPPAPAVATAVK